MMAENGGSYEVRGFQPIGRLLINKNAEGLKDNGCALRKCPCSLDSRLRRAARTDKTLLKKGKISGTGQKWEKKLRTFITTLYVLFDAISTIACLRQKRKFSGLTEHISLHSDIMAHQQRIMVVPREIPLLQERIFPSLYRNGSVVW